MRLETFYVGRRHAYRSVAAAAAHEPQDEVIPVDAPAGASRLWRLDGQRHDRPYVTADWAIAWQLAARAMRRIQPLDVVG